MTIDELIADAVKRYSGLPFEERRRMREAQRKSWIIGEMMLEHPEMTREYAEKLFDGLYK